MWEVLREYPAVRVKLEAIAVKRLEKHKKTLIEIVNLERCNSAPGLIEPSTLVKNEKLCNVGRKRYSTEPSANITKLSEYSPFRRRLSSISKSSTKESIEKIIPILAEENLVDKDNENESNFAQEVRLLRKRLIFLENENKRLMNTNSSTLVDKPIHIVDNDNNILNNDEYCV